MNVKYILFLLIIASGCYNSDVEYHHEIIIGEQVNAEIIDEIDRTEQALIAGYLMVYGNECTLDSGKPKCQLLELLGVSEECDLDYIERLKKWFRKEELLYYKFNRCPVLPHKSAIQNTIKSIVVDRNKDTISITIHVIGLNNVQEKNWDIEQTDSYLVKDHEFLKLLL